MPLDPFNHSKVLFLEAGRKTALLVITKAGRRRQRPMPFGDAHQALTWCLENGAAFICLPSPPQVAGN